MFRSVLKHDFKAIARYYWIIAVALVGLSFTAAISIRLLSAYDDAPILLYLFGTFIIMAAYVALIGSVILVSLLIYLRFYQNFYSDEGYLTFTLPVKRKTLLLSKTLNALIWESFLGLLLLFCIFIFALIAPDFGDGLLNLDLFTSIIDFFVEGWQTLGVWLIVYILEGIGLIVLLAFASIALIQFCITVGAVIARRAKLLAGIGIGAAIMYGLNAIISLLFSAFVLVGIDAILYITLELPSGMVHFLLALFLLLVSVIVGGAGLMFYFMTRDRIEHRLNLT